MDKQAFMRACREGGAAIEAALRALDRSFFALLYRESIRVLRNSDAARDLVQDTFISVWQKCCSYRGDSELLPWIRAILRNAIIDHLRRARPEEPLEDAAGEMSAKVTRAVADASVRQIPRPDDEVARGELAACFRRCQLRFEEASPMHAAVIRWIAEDGLSNDEIAALLGRTPGATREFISQCRKKARVYYAEWYAMVQGSGAAGLVSGAVTPSSESP